MTRIGLVVHLEVCRGGLGLGTVGLVRVPESAASHSIVEEVEFRLLKVSSGGARHEKDKCSREKTVSDYPGHPDFCRNESSTTHLFHPRIVLAIENAILQPVQVRPVFARPVQLILHQLLRGVDGRGARRGTGGRVLGAEMFLAALLGILVEVVDSGEVGGAGTEGPAELVGVPGAVNSWAASSPCVELEVRGASVVTLLVGREAKSRIAVAL